MSAPHNPCLLWISRLLLTALARAHRGWSDSAAPLLIDLEGHGREELGEDLDLSRTAGWFTTLFPVLLQLGGVGEIAQDLRAQSVTQAHVFESDHAPLRIGRASSCGAGALKDALTIRPHNR